MSVVDHAAFLGRLHRNGHQLNVFYDVGASIGRWSCEAQKVYPDARYELFEPLAGRYAELDQAAQYDKLRNYSLHRVGLSNESGSSRIKILGNRGVGSSILILDSDYRKDTKFVDVELYTMDEYVSSNGLLKPDFIKLDTQAAELKVLAGAKECLKSCQFVLLETWARRVYGPETPLFHEIADFLYRLDYCLFEILSLSEGRDTDGTLRWFDAVFINKAFSKFPRGML